MLGVSEKKKEKLEKDLNNKQGMLEKGWLLKVFEREKERMYI